VGLLDRLFHREPASTTPAVDDGQIHDRAGQTAEQQAETRRRMEAELDAQRARRQLASPHE
jgi:hypothetical protein